MAAPERTAALVAAARQRHHDTRVRAVAALRRLDSSGETINITTVSQAAGVSRAWLYRQSDLRALIDTTRQTRPNPGRSNRPHSEQATVASLRQQLDALRALQAELQEENRQLRETLARKLGRQRTQGTVASTEVDAAPLLNQG